MLQERCRRTCNPCWRGYGDHPSILKGGGTIPPRQRDPRPPRRGPCLSSPSMVAPHRGASLSAGLQHAKPRLQACPAPGLPVRDAEARTEKTAGACAPVRTPFHSCLTRAESGGQ
ncbi:hypothetical protein ABB33_06435 [Stenotrophomonas acidaminiphila]|nr:hypothetical protein ABB33_06435 [Stenotrophomonas acidaminiphila]